jgi:anaerobic selenocysteine-containing dehydrogenase
MNEITKINSVCGLCSGYCGIIITLEEGIPVFIKGNPDNPNNKGGLCPKGRAALELLTAPGRLKHPLKRIGKRGEGKWQQISWDQAIDETATALLSTRDKLGAEAIMMAHGSDKAFIDTHLVRLANALGTPNLCTADNICHVPHMLASEYTFGFWPGSDTENPPGIIMIWGSNRAETGIFKNQAILEAVSKGAKLIVIDPFRTQNAAKADLWLQLKPGTDAALALGMLHVMVEEVLYDSEFVSQWSLGFNLLKKHLKQYTPEHVSQITWIPAEKIIEATRLYSANRPGKIEWGNGLDQNNNSFQASRAIAFLMALSGNLEVPGGEIRGHGTGFRYGGAESSGSRIHGRWSAELELRNLISKENRKKRVSGHLVPDFRYISSQDAVTAMLEAKPYRLAAAFIQGVNPLNSWSNSSRVAEGFKKLDFLAVSDLFLTPSANLADIVFPAASYLEFDGVVLPISGNRAYTQRKVSQVGECRSDHEIINALAWKLGLGDSFWKDMNHFWDYILNQAGISFNEFMTQDIYTSALKVSYRSYENTGFNTPSGKVEFFSDYLEENGFDSMPGYSEHPENTCSSGSDEEREYPLICTCKKIRTYRQSSGKQLPSLRKAHPDPLLSIHPDTAKSLDIKDGDWLIIENPRGRIRQKAVLTDKVDPRVVYADSGWWYPERGAEFDFGWLESNFNALSPDNEPSNPEVGSFHLRGFRVKVHKATF